MMATVIVTGGGGFLGQCLANELLRRGSIQSEKVSISISKIILADVRFPSSILFPALEDSGIVTRVTGSVAEVSFCKSLLLDHHTDNSHVSIFHLGAVMSGDGERDFDLCMNVNLFGFLNILEAARDFHNKNSSERVKLIFASAGATIGAGADTDYITKDDVICDSTRATPHTTYGTTKACCELLLADYTRRGFVDARGLRLPTIVVRAGAPNAATTSCFSAVVREPLNANTSTTALPIARNLLHAVTGKRAAIQAMLILHDALKETIDTTLGFDRTVFLPAVALSLGDLEDALRFKVVAESSRAQLGTVTYPLDEDDGLNKIVGSFPTKIDASRAIQLGIPPAPTAELLVREYIADFPSAIAPGIEIIPSVEDAAAPPMAAPIMQSKVAVVTGAGSGIGRAVSIRLAKGGWNVLVLAGRRRSALEETARLIGKESSSSACCCVPTDVTVQGDVEKLFELVRQKYGTLDLLFNNAGIASPAASVEATKVEDFERVLKTNVYGPFLCARAAMKLMADSGRGGRIINNGSISAHTPRPGSAPYTTSKHALSGLTKCIALDGRAINVACGQIDFGNVVSEISLTTNKVGQGALQANGSHLEEPMMTMDDAAETFWTMANLPLEANVLHLTVMATNMPFVGRG